MQETTADIEKIYQQLQELYKTNTTASAANEQERVALELKLDAAIEKLMQLQTQWDGQHENLNSLKEFLDVFASPHINAILSSLYTFLVTLKGDLSNEERLFINEFSQSFPGLTLETFLSLCREVLSKNIHVNNAKTQSPNWYAKYLQYLPEFETWISESAKAQADTAEDEAKISAGVQYMVLDHPLPPHINARLWHQRPPITTSEEMAEVLQNIKRDLQSDITVDESGIAINEADIAPLEEVVSPIMNKVFGAFHAGLLESIHTFEQNYFSAFKHESKYEHNQILRAAIQSRFNVYNYFYYSLGGAMEDLLADLLNLSEKNLGASIEKFIFEHQDFVAQHKLQFEQLIIYTLDTYRYPYLFPDAKNNEQIKDELAQLALANKLSVPGLFSQLVKGYEERKKAEAQDAFKEALEVAKKVDEQEVAAKRKREEEDKKYQEEQKKKQDARQVASAKPTTKTSAPEEKNAVELQEPSVPKTLTAAEKKQQEERKKAGEETRRRAQQALKEEEKSVENFTQALEKEKEKFNKQFQELQETYQKLSIEIKNLFPLGTIIDRPKFEEKVAEMRKLAATLKGVCNIEALFQRAVKLPGAEQLRKIAAGLESLPEEEKIHKIATELKALLDKENMPSNAAAGVLADMAGIIDTFDQKLAAYDKILAEANEAISVSAPKPRGKS